MTVWPSASPEGSTRAPAATTVDAAAATTEAAAATTAAAAAATTAEAAATTAAATAAAANAGPVTKLEAEMVERLSPSRGVSERADGERRRAADDAALSDGPSAFETVRRRPSSRRRKRHTPTKKTPALRPATSSLQSRLHAPRARVRTRAHARAASTCPTAPTCSSAHARPCANTELPHARREDGRDQIEAAAKEIIAPRWPLW